MSAALKAQVAILERKLAAAETALSEDRDCAACHARRRERERAEQHAEELRDAPEGALPRRREITPVSLTQRVEDLVEWTQAMRMLKKQALAAGFTSVKTRCGGSGPASWGDAYAYLTRTVDGVERCVEVFAISDAASPEPGDGCAIVRQYDPQTKHTGPNHSRGLTTVEAVVALAVELVALPFERDRCAHCGSDDGKRSANDG